MFHQIVLYYVVSIFAFNRISSFIILFTFSHAILRCCCNVWPFLRFFLFFPLLSSIHFRFFARFLVIVVVFSSAMSKTVFFEKKLWFRRKRLQKLKCAHKQSKFMRRAKTGFHYHRTRFSTLKVFGYSVPCFLILLNFFCPSFVIFLKLNRPLSRDGGAKELRGDFGIACSSVLLESPLPLLPSINTFVGQLAERYNTLVFLVP